MPEHLDPVRRPRGKVNAVEDGPVTACVTKEKLETPSLVDNAQPIVAQCVEEQASEPSRFESEGQSLKRPYVLQGRINEVGIIHMLAHLNI